MEDDWEQLADKGVPEVKAAADVNKWAGEDEEEEVKDSWEDEEEAEEEKKDEEKVEQKPVTSKVKPKTKLQEKIAEKERLAMEKDEEERLANMTPEEKIAEKLRLQKMQEEADLKIAMETLGITPTDLAQGGIDGMVPTNRAEFNELAQAISTKVSLFRSKDEFPGFVEELIRNISLHLSAIDLKRIKTAVDSLYVEKQKLEKEKTKKPKKTNKPRLRIEMNAINDEFTGMNDKFDVDDFM